jgi:hypothetical protein
MKKQTAITIGSVVQLKSGGPQMTVVKGVSGTDTILTVLWIAEERYLQKADIVIQAFKLVR